jgi:DNA-binding IclR family transcriptional regulator
MANAVQNTEHTATAVPALVTACRILGALARPGQPGPTLSELARELEVPKSTVHNQLATLEAQGYVAREEGTRGFRLGAALISLGLAAGRQLRSTALVAERLPRLALEQRVTVGIAQVMSADEAVLLDCAYPAEDIHVGLTLGSRYGFFDGAVGKCLLAALASEDAERLVRRQGVPRRTAHTIVDVDAFLADLERVRRRGWAASARELKENHAIAAPLRNQAGGLDLVIFAVAFPAQLQESRFAELGQLLVDTARRVEAATGAAGATP